MSDSVVLVGEMNPYSSEPRFALYPAPAYSAGWRLCRHLGLTRAEYLRRFQRVNLCALRWNDAMARQTAAMVLAERPRLAVLLGARVARAFGVKFEPYTVATVDGVRLMMLPHPSGRCRLWNWSGAGAAARVLLANVLNNQEVLHGA